MYQLVEFMLSPKTDLGDEIMVVPVPVPQGDYTKRTVCTFRRLVETTTWTGTLSISLFGRRSMMGLHLPAYVYVHYNMHLHK